MATPIQSTYVNEALKKQLNSFGNLTIQVGTPVNAVAAVGRITFTGNADPDEFFRINNTTLTFKASAANENQITLGGTAELTIDACVTAINVHTVLSLLCIAVKVSTDKLQVTWLVKGAVGNAVVFTEAIALATANGSGFLGGTTFGIDGTIGSLNEIKADTSYVYMTIADNTTADINWRRISLGSTY